MEHETAIDGMVLSYLVQAHEVGYDPLTDPDQTLAKERMAAYKIFLYIESPATPPTVRNEIEAIKDIAQRRQHQSFCDVLIPTIVKLDNQRVEERAKQYFKYHHTGKNSQRDCHIVAEAELGQRKVLLTFDHDLKKHLQRRTGSLQIKMPSEYWEELQIPKGTLPKRRPHPSNPISRATWWLA